MLTAPERGFAPAEFEHRVSRAQKAMKLADMDALLLTTHADIFYFSGFLTQFWQSPTRPWFLLIPQSGKPVAIIPTIGVECMQRTWLTDIRSWPSPNEHDDGIGLVISTVKELCGQSPKLAVPMGHETYLRLPLNSITQLQEAFAADTPWLDATQLVRDVRAIKSEHEIEKIRYACSIASTAFERVPSYDLAGRNEIDLFRQFKISCLELGADDCAYLVGASGPDGYTDVISPAGDRQLRAGDIFILDTGCVWDGYHCDFDRNYAVGHASEQAHSAYKTLWDATEQALTSVKPGMTCSDLYHVMMNAMPGADGGSVGRIGHGLGIDLTEPPSLTSFDTTELKAGMVMTLEPGLNYGNGLTMVHEENIVIRDNGAELLSRRAAQELPICQRI